MRSIISVIIFLVCGGAYAANCPSITSDCPSPTYNNLTVGGALTVTGGQNFTGGGTLGGSWTIGSNSNPAAFGIVGQNQLIVTPGSSSSSAVALSQSGTGGITLQSGLVLPASGGLQGTSWLNVGNGKNLTNSGAISLVFQSSIGSISGTVTGSGVQAWNSLSNGFDTADAHTLSNQLVMERINYAYGGSGMEGGRAGLTIQSSLTSESSNAAHGINPFYGSANFWLSMNATDGGTAPTLAGGVGQAISLNPQTVLNGSASNFLEASIAEYDIAVQTGASVAKKFGIKIVPLPTDAVQGNVADAALKFGGAQGAVGWKNAILFGGDIAYWMQTGELIKAEYSTQQSINPNTSVWGIDLLEDSISNFGTGGAFRSQGFTVGGDAKVQIGDALFTPTTTALTLDVPGAILNTSSINTAGSSCAVHDILLFGNGGRAIVNTLSGSGVATYTILNNPYDFSGSPPATLAATAYPSSAGPCSGVVLNVTWSVGATINIGNASATAINIGNSGSTTTITGTIKAGSSTGQSQTCTVNQAKTLIFTNGILTGGTCNS